MDVPAIENKLKTEDIHHLSDRQKLIWLMDKYGDDVIRLAFSYVRTKQTAEDISQEVFLNCYQNLNSFRGDASYKTWLYKITINKCKDYLKTWSYRNIIFTEITNNLFTSSSKSADEQFFQRNNQQELAEIIFSLPLKYREVIIFYYYEHLSLPEISKLLRVNINTVKSRLVRGKKLLAKKLGGKDIG